MWDHAVWDAAQQKGITQRMPLEEANSYQRFYALMTVMAGVFANLERDQPTHGFDLLDPRSDPPSESAVG